MRLGVKRIERRNVDLKAFNSHSWVELVDNKAVRYQDVDNTDCVLAHQRKEETWQLILRPSVVGWQN